MPRLAISSEYEFLKQVMLTDDYSFHNRKPRSVNKIHLILKSLGITIKGWKVYLCTSAINKVEKVRKKKRVNARDNATGRKKINITNTITLHELTSYPSLVPLLCNIKYEYLQHLIWTTSNDIMILLSHSPVAGNAFNFCSLRLSIFFPSLFFCIRLFHLSRTSIILVAVDIIYHKNSSS